MRILYFVNAAWYFELHWLERAKSLQAEGYEVHLVSNFSDEKIKNEIENLGFICWQLNIDRFSINPFSNIKVFFDFYKLQKKIKPDLIHLITIKPVVLGGIVSTLTNIPTVVSIVGLGRVFQTDSILKKLIKRLYRIILSKNKKLHIIFEHEDDMNTIKEFCPLRDENTHVIDGAGVDTTKFKYCEEVVSESVNILFASRMLKAKGLEILVESVRYLKSQGVNVTLNVAGIIDESDPDRIEIKTVTGWHDAGEINWLGRRNDVEVLLKECNIMVLPTQYAEGIPRIILEACSVGRACIVGNMPGCNSVIEHLKNGITLSDFTVEELTEKLIFLITNPEIRKQYGKISSEMICNHYSTEIITSETLKVYKKAVC